jgi:RES domain-containing protein
LNLSALKELLPGGLPPEKIYYRVVNSHYAQEIDEITHTMHYSWRYNPSGEFGVLYLSSSANCAFQEKLRQVNGRKEDLPLQAAGRFRVKLNCLDLTDRKTLKILEVNPLQLIDRRDFTTTQNISREARKLGFEGIAAPSAIGEECHTLVVFKDKLNPPSYCRLLDVNTFQPV